MKRETKGTGLVSSAAFCHPDPRAKGLTRKEAGGGTGRGLSLGRKVLNVALAFVLALGMTPPFTRLPMTA